MPFLVFLIVLVLLIFWLISLYNRLVSLRNKRQNAFADIDVQLRLRHDLVYQLIETVKGYTGHERDVLIKITEARASAVAAKTIDEKITAEQQLSAALRGFRLQVEAYPDLKANQNFLRLQDELSTIENRLADARRFFNNITTEYNNAVETFPSNLLASNFGFQREMLFDLGTERRETMEEPPLIKF
jgi:LemA protein